MRPKRFTERMHIAFPPGTMKKMDKVSESMGQTPSEWLRAVVRAALQDEGYRKRKLYTRGDGA